MVYYGIPTIEIWLLSVLKLQNETKAHEVSEEDYNISEAKGKR